MTPDLFLMRGLGLGMRLVRRGERREGRGREGWEGGRMGWRGKKKEGRKEGGRMDLKLTPIIFDC